MKTASRIIAIIMVIAMLAAVMTGCGGKKGKKPVTTEKDDRLIGTWVQTDEVDGNWTWIFNADGTCSLKGKDFDSAGTYAQAGSELGKLRIKLDAWSEDKLFTYAVTEKVLDLEESFSSYYLFKQQ